MLWIFVSRNYALLFTFYRLTAKEVLLTSGIFKKLVYLKPSSAIVPPRVTGIKGKIMTQLILG